VNLVEVEPSTGLLWRSGCGQPFEEVFLDGTEPEENCSPRPAPRPIWIDYEEPPVISPEQSQEWSTQIPGLGEVQVVIDPAAKLPPEREDEDPDVLDEEEREAVDEQLEEQLDEARRRVEELLPEAAPVPVPPPFEDGEGPGKGKGRGKAKGKGPGR
jgi:hypothetical protein